MKICKRWETSLDTLTHRIGGVEISFVSSICVRNGWGRGTRLLQVFLGASPGPQQQQPGAEVGDAGRRLLFAWLSYFFFPSGASFLAAQIR